MKGNIVPAASAPANASKNMPTTTKKSAAPAARAFRIGVQTTDEIDYDDTRSLTASSQDLPVLNVPPAGFLQNLFILVEYTVAANAIATVVVSEDYPWRLIDTVTFEDVNNAPIVGPMTGWDLYLVNKYGGYYFSDDPRFSPVYRLDTLTGTNATASSAAFVLRIPVELVERDALGALPNKSGSAMFKVRLRVTASGVVYTTPPTTLGTIRTRIQQADWWEPDSTDLKGRPLAQNPPAVQTTQYWSKVDYTLSAGSARQKFDRVGYLVRNFVFVLRDSSATPRANGEANWPDPFMLRVEGNTLVTRLRKVWWHRLADQGYFGTNPQGSSSSTPVSIGDNYSGANIGVTAKDNGVYALPFCDEFAFGKPGSETRRGYLETSSAARVEFQGTIGNGGTSPYTFTVFTNDVAPANGDDAQLTV